MVCLLAVCISGRIWAQTYAYYTNSATGSWSGSGSWTGSQPTAGGATNAFIVLQPSAGTMLATNDLAGGFLVNEIAAWANAVSLYGNALVLTNNGAALPLVTNNSGNPLNLYTPITLGANATFGLANNITNNGVISGSSTLTVGGAGTLTLTNANSYTGSTTVNGGKLRLVSPGSIYSPAWNPNAIVTINSGAVLEFDNWGYGPGVSFGQLDYGSARIVINGGTLRSVLASGNYGYHGCNIGVLGGTLDSSVSGQLWTVAFSSGYGSMSLGGLLTVTGAGNGEIDKQLTGAGGVTMSGAGTWTLTASTNSFTGPVTVSSGTLALGGAGLLGSGTYAAAITNNSLIKDGSSGVQTLSGVISGSGMMVQTGSGTLILTGTNTYSGGTTNSAGILEADSGNALGSGLLTLSGGVLSNSVSSTLTNNISLAAAGAVGVSGGSTLALGGVISGSGALAGNGPGTLTLTNQNIYTGNTTVNGGKLRLVAPGSVYSATYNNTAIVTVNSGAVLEFDNLSYGAAYSFGQLDYGSARMVVNGGTLRSVAAAGAYGYRGFNIGVLGGTLDSSVSGQLWTVAFNNGYGSMSLGGLLTVTGAGNGEIDKQLTGAGGVTMSGAGTWTLTASTNSFTGPVTVSSGTLALGGAGLLGSGTYAAAITNNSLIKDGSSGVQTLSGVISGSGMMVQTGSGTLILTGTNTYSGGTTNSAGILEADSGNALGSGLLTLSGGVLSNSVSSTLTNNISLAAAGAVGVSGGSTLALGGVISGSGALAGNGPGTLTLTNQNIYTGNTTVNGGKLRLVAPGSVYSATYNNTAIVTVNSGAVLEFDNLSYGAAYSFGQLDYGSARMVVNGGTLRSVAAAGAYGYRGFNIGVLGGTLDSSVSGQLWTVAYQAGFGAVNLSGLLTVSGAGNGQVDKAINGSGGVTKTGAGTWTLTSSTNGFTGPVTISAGILALAGYGSVTNTPLISVAGGAILDVSGLTNSFVLQPGQTLSNSAAATGVIKGSLNTGTGVLSVSYNTGAPAFTVTNGTLSLSSGTAVSVNNTGTVLGLGNYLIIGTNANGAVAGPAPASVTVGGNGVVAGATAALIVSNSNLYLQISQPTTTILATSVSPSAYGQGVTFTATIAPAAGSTVPTGTVQFKTNGVSLGLPIAVTSGTGSNGTAAFGTASLPATVSPYLVTAEFIGTGNFLNSTNSPALSQTVNKAILFVQTVPTAGAITYGQPLASSPVTGAAFTNAAGGVVALAATNFVTPTLVPSRGTTNVLVYFLPADSADYSPATNTVTVTVNAATLTITANSTNKMYGQNLILPNSLISAAGLTNGDAVASVTLTCAGLTNAAAAGNYNITPSAATGTGLGNYTIGYVNGNLTVNPAGPTLTVGSSQSPIGYLGSVSFSAMLPADATGSVVFSSTNGAFSTNTLSAGTASSLAITNLARGTNAITVVYGGDGNYLAATNLFNEVVTNHAPVAGLMTVTITAGMGGEIALTDLATNWTDVDGDTVELTGINLATTNGTSLFPIDLMTNLDGSLVITNLSYLGYTNPSNVADQISYSIGDGFGGTNVGYINIVIQSSVTGTNSITGITGGNPNGLTAYGVPGFSYVTERSTNLTDWVEISTNTAATNGVISVTDPFSDLGGNAPAAAYYRLLWQP